MVFNNIILCPGEEQRLELPMNENVIDGMMQSGLYSFWMGNQIFYIEVLPIAFQAKGYSYLREEAKQYYCQHVETRESLNSLM